MSYYILLKSLTFTLFFFSALNVCVAIQMIELESEKAQMAQLVIDYWTKLDGAITTKDLASQIDNESVLIYYEKDEELVCLLINSDNYFVFNSEFDEVSISIFALAVARQSFYQKNLEENYLNFEKETNILYELLIEPVKEHLKTKVAILCEDGLASVPWDALQIESSQSINKLPYYLLFDHEVRLLNSLSQIRLQKKVKVTRIDFLGFAPEFHGAMFLENEEELIQVSHELSKRIQVGNMDAQQLIKSLETNNSKIIHFSSHAELDSCELSKSGILVDGNKDKLSIEQILDIQIGASLVFLNTCKSAEATECRTMTISDAFIAAGARATIATLWEVEDKAAREIARETYEAIKLGASCGDALRSAKISYINESNSYSMKHPIFWSGYQLYGQNEVILDHSVLRIRTLLSWALSFMTTFSMIGYYFGNRIRKKILSRNWV